jgi:murein L,D-transpeptidase YcbB/YkuD
MALVLGLTPVGSPALAEQAAGEAATAVTTGAIEPVKPATDVAAETAAPAAAPAAAAVAEVDPILVATRQRLATLSVSAAEREDLAALVAYYGERKGAPLWVSSAGFTAKGSAALDEIAKADDWGLTASSFQLPKLSAGAGTDALAEAEARLSLAVAKYARHARGGRIDPNKLSKYIDVQPPLIAPKQVLEQIAEASEPAAYLRSLHPKHPQFAALRQALLKLRAPQAPAAEPAKPEPEVVRIPDGKLIKPGANHPDVALLRKRLNVPATSGASETHYDAMLQTAVRVFQSEHGIDSSGVVNAKTRRALNGANAPAVEKVKPDKEAERLVLNMERWRWLPSDLGELHVWDNVPEFMMRVLRADKTIHQEKIIVGKTNTPTPTFSARMQYVIFHPEWGVPDSIKVKEILPYLRPSNEFSFFGGSTTDTRVLQRHNLRVSYNGRPVDASQVDWSQVDIRRYTFIQPSGGGNVLGVVKFRFPNKHDVYMHDTPQRDLFSQSKRMFSHGCMRVHNPQRLAEVVLGEDQGMSPDKVKDLIAHGSKTEITLKSPIPVHVTYMTAVADESGKVQYFSDVYGHDQRLQLALSGKQTEFADPVEDSAVVARAPRLPRQKQASSGASDLFSALFGN